MRLWSGFEEPLRPTVAVTTLWLLCCGDVPTVLEYLEAVTS